MHKLLLCLAVFAAIYACTNTNSNGLSAKNTNNTDLSQSTGPDAADLLNTLQGRWQSLQDSTYILEVADTKMRYFLHGKLNSETDIEVDGSCQVSPCKIDSTNLTDGWCFREKRQYDVQCIIVVTCDKEFLKFNPAGHEDQQQSFKKL